MVQTSPHHGTAHMILFNKINECVGRGVNKAVDVDVW